MKTMPKRTLRFAGMTLALLLAGGARGAGAGTSFDFLFSMDHVSNDNQLFLNLAVSNYGYDQAVLAPVLPRVRYVEVDLPVILFLARESGRPIDYIVDLRAGGAGWSVIFAKVGVPYDVLFVGIRDDPGPPYGKAWGHWKKNPRQARLSDADIRGLVQVQVGAHLVGSSPYELAKVSGQGRTVVTYVADHKDRPYKGGHPGKKGGGKGKNKGHGKH